MKLLSLVLIASLILCSCKNQRYVPSNVNMTFFEEKGQTHVELGFSNQLELHGAYAISNHFSVQAMTTFGSLRGDELLIIEGDSVVGKILTVTPKLTYQLAGGYQLKLRPKLVFETYLGFTYGHGLLKQEHVYTYGREGSLRKDNNNKPFGQVFIQPAIGYNGKNIDWGFALKTSMLAINDPSAIGFIYEPIFQFAFGGPKLKCELQLGARVSKKIPGIGFGYRYIHTGIGIRYMIGAEY